MNKLLLALLLCTLLGCSADRWDKRYRKEAEDLCSCYEPWQNSMSQSIKNFYESAMENYDPYSSNEISDEQIQRIIRLRNQLSTHDLEWNRKLGREFRDKNSTIYKCRYKSYPWSHESPGNNYNGTPDSQARQMNCYLVYTLPFISLSKQLESAIFD